MFGDAAHGARRICSEHGELSSAGGDFNDAAANVTASTADVATSSAAATGSERYPSARRDHSTTNHCPAHADPVTSTNALSSSAVAARVALSRGR